MQRTKDFERFVAACDFPGGLHPDVIEESLKTYLSALGIERQVVRLEAGWELDQHPPLRKYVDAVLDELVRRNPKLKTARAALDALDARAALAARAARAALDALDALAARAAWDALDALDARAALDALDARAALDALDARAAWDADPIASLRRFAAWCIQSWGWGYWRFDLSWMATTHIGAQQLGKSEVDRWAQPLFEAYIAGCWMLHWTEETLYWVAKPTVHVEVVNGNRRLHNDKYAAIESDVENLYFWHGVLVPAFVVVRPDWITAHHIETESNAEVRRVMIERMGYEKYILESGAQLIHSDETGALYRKELPDDEPLMAVHVLNSTPEPDGSVKRYMLRVPPNVERARQAVAWTFDVPEEDYQPLVET
jgi:uncharacterized protein DUF6745